MRTIAGTTWSVEDAQAYIKARVKVDENGCWIWQLSKNTAGYGVGHVPHPYRAPRATTLAHRISYMAIAGENIDGLCVCHRCDVPACCNPAHLFLGTHADNVADKVKKGRHQHGENHCQTGLTDDDIRLIRASATSGAALARRFGITQASICDIRKRRTWKHVD